MKLLKIPNYIAFQKTKISSSIIQNNISFYQCKFFRSYLTALSQLKEEATLTLDEKRDINIKGMNQGLALFDQNLAWYHFTKLKDTNKVHLCTPNEVSELLKSIKYPDYGRADPYIVQVRLSQILETVKAIGIDLDESDYRHVLSIYGFLGLEMEVGELWKDMKAKNEFPSIYFYNSLAYAYLALKRPSMVLEILKELEENHIKLDGQFYLNLMQAYGMMRNGELVINTFDRFLHYSQNYTLPNYEKGLQVSSQAYRKFFSCLQMCGETYLQTSSQYFDKMIQDGIKPKEIHFQIIMDHHLRNDYIPEALRWFHSMKTYDIDPRMETYVDYITHYMRGTFIENFANEISQKQLHELINALKIKLTKTNERNIRSKLKSGIKRASRYLKSFN